MSMTITAKSHCVMMATRPRIVFVVDDDAACDRRRFDYMGFLLENATFEVSEKGNSWHLLGHAGEGKIFHRRVITPNVGGRYKIKTVRGPTTYNHFTWSDRDDPWNLRGLIDAEFQYRGTGNIQYGSLDLETALKAAEGLPFAYDSRRQDFAYTGELARRADTYAAANRLTFGTRYYTLAFKGAQEEETCGGFLWPDEPSAKAACDHFVQTGERLGCWNLREFESRFPGHPLTEKIRKLVKP